MDNYRQIIADTLVGANVITFCKSTSAEIEQASSDLITKTFEDGLSLFTYFGHSSSTVLGFNIDNPQNYNNAGKYAFFSVNGCNAGDFFVFDNQRFSFSQTLSEKFTLAKQRGSIGFLASTHFGIVNYLNIFINSMYGLMSKDDYGAPVGKINEDAAKRMLQISGYGDFYARLTAEEMTLHGDPAMKLNVQSLPDYIQTINSALTGIDTALKPIPGQVADVNGSLQSIRGSAQSIDGSLKDTSRALINTSGSLMNTAGALGSADQSLGHTSSGEHSKPASDSNVLQAVGDIVNSIPR